MKYWIFFLNYNYIFCTIHYSKHYLFFNLCSLECVSYAAACWQHAVSYTEQPLQLTLCSLDCAAYVVNSTMNVIVIFFKNDLINFIRMDKLQDFFLNYHYIFCTIHYFKYCLFFNMMKILYEEKRQFLKKLCNLDCPAYALQLILCSLHCAVYSVQPTVCSLGCIVYIFLPML